MKTKIFLACAVCLGLGYFIGRGQSKAIVQIPIETPANLKLDALQNIADVDIQEYYRLKNAEERYKKADEILEKIIKIFLADLGMKISKPKDFNERTAEVLHPNAAPIELAVSAKPNIQQAPPKTSNQILRTSLADLRTANEIEEFLKASKIENFEDTIKTSAGFSNKSGILQNFIGRFTGSAQVILGEATERWDIEMMLNAKMTGGRLEGKRLLKLSKDGKTFSNSEGEGSLDEQYRETTQDTEAIIIAAGPNTFLQAYYVPATDQVVGSVMRKNSLNEAYKPIGSFALNRH